MPRIHRLLGAALAALVLFGTAGAGAASADRRPRPADQVTVFALTAGGRIATFPLDNPKAIQNIVSIRGLARGEEVVGFDRRPANDTFYAVAQSRSGASLYTVDPSTGRATLVAPLVSAPTAANPNRTPVVLNGTEFGVDFNPAADALRVVSDTGQNLRIIPSARTAADGTALQPGDTFTDGMLNRGTPPATVTGVTGAAYTNNDTDPATATMLYVIDADRDELSLQNPPNAGTLTNTVPLSKRTGPRVGFDIRTTATGDLAVASLTNENRIPRTRLVVVDLATGNVTSQGNLFGVALRDIALAK
jgi:hypothetical protein